jgi:hypothetical protein
VFGAVIAALFAASLAAWVLVTRAGESNRTALIYKNGELIEEVMLSAVSREYEITIDDDGVNVVLVKPGEISVIYADCPTQICVNTGVIRNGIIPIICLPNRLEIRITGGVNELDAVAR